MNVHRPVGKVLDVSRELAMSIRAVDTEVQFEKEIILHPSLVVDAFSPPRGPMVWIKKAELTENPKIPRKVDAVVGDTDARAVDGAKELYGSSISTYHLQRLLSAGLLGQKRRRHLVPTRWSITAMDDLIGKELMKQVREFQEIGEVLLYHGSYVGNHFHIIFIPRPWSFEMLETWLKGAFFVCAQLMGLGSNLTTPWSYPRGSSAELPERMRQHLFWTYRKTRIMLLGFQAADLKSSFP